MADIHTISHGKRRRLPSSLVVLLSLVLCCQAPNLVFFVFNGSFPVGDPNRYTIRVGMTQDEVRAVLGNPHNRKDQDGDGEIWHYKCDPFGISIWSIRFSPQGNVESDWW